MNIDHELTLKKWARLRGAILARDNYLDQVMRRYGKNVGADTVHHIFPREYFPEYTFAEWNLISVSRATHNALHDRETHKLTAKGWDLLKRTARKNNIELDERIRDAIVSSEWRTDRPGQKSNL